MAKVEKFFSELSKFKKCLAALVLIAGFIAGVQLGSFAGRAHGIADAKLYYTTKESTIQYLMNQGYDNQYAEPQLYDNIYQRATAATDDAVTLKNISAEIEKSRFPSLKLIK